MLQMLIDTGMRAGEAGLDVDDLDSEQGVAVVMGKGRRGRAVPQTRRATHPSTSRYELFTRSPPPIHSGRAPPAA